MWNTLIDESDTIFIWAPNAREHRKRGKSRRCIAPTLTFRAIRGLWVGPMRNEKAVPNISQNSYGELFEGEGFRSSVELSITSTGILPKVASNYLPESQMRYSNAYFHFSTARYP